MPETWTPPVDRKPQWQTTPPDCAGRWVERHPAHSSHVQFRHVFETTEGELQLENGLWIIQQDAPLAHPDVLDGKGWLWFGPLPEAPGDTRVA